MKKLIYILLLLLFPAALSAQDYKVESVEHLPTDMTARTHIKKDGKDRQCAVLRFATQGIAAEKRDGFFFQSDFGSEVVERSTQNGEIWLWVSPGIKTLRIMHNEFGSYELHFTKYLADAVQELHTYKVLLKAVAVTPVAPAVVKYNYLIVKADQTNAMIYIDDDFVGTGSVSKSFVVGETHKWRIECSFYHSESGEAVILENEKVNVTKTLRPAFGYINVTSKPESGASVLIDGNLVGVTPFKTDRLASGQHSVKVMKEMYNEAEQTFTVTDGNTTEAAMVLSANFVNVDITTDSNSDIYIDNELKGRGSWKGRLSDGSHTFEARKTSHKSSYKTVILTKGKDENISVAAPTPIYGTLDVNSDPMEAAIFIDGVRRGETPAIINDILVGTHELKLEKTGCASITKSITIGEKNMLMINEKLEKFLGNESKYSGYNTTKNGLHYQFIEKYRGNLPQVDELVEVTLSCTVNDTMSIIPASMNVLKLVEPKFTSDFMEGIAMMHIGDSASFIVNIDSTFKHVFGAKELPSEFKSTDIMRFNVRVNDIFQESDYAKKMIEKMKNNNPEETAKAATELKNYMKEKGVVAKPKESGLIYVKTKNGNGKMPQKENTVKVHYTGKLLDGTVFDSSIERGEPIEFPLGAGYVIPGWDEGIALMSKGEKGILYIPWYLAYGDKGAGGMILPYANLIFEVELVDFE